MQSHNMSADDVENTNGTNLEGDFAKKLRTVPRGTERMLQV